MSRLALFTIVLLPFAIACDNEPSEKGVDPIPSSSAPYCDDVETAMSADDVGSFGVSGADFLAQIPANAFGEVAFEGADASDLEVEVTVDADSLRFVESTAMPAETDGPVPAIGVMCADRIEVNAQMALVTADGQLAETIDLVLSLQDPARAMNVPGAVEFRTELDPDGIDGALDIGEFVNLEEYDTVSLYLNGGIVDGVLAGTLEALAEVDTGDGKDDVVMAALFPVADFDATALAD